MSMDELRRLSSEEIGEARQALLNRLVNLRYVAGSGGSPPNGRDQGSPPSAPASAESIGLQTVEINAGIRALSLAEQAITSAYRKLTETETTEGKPAPQDRSPY